MSAEKAPFPSAEAAWFATMEVFVKRRAGEPDATTFADDVLKCLDRLYRQRSIELAHARTLRIWGEKGRAPDSARPTEREDARLWREALSQMDYMLRVKGIVA